MRSIVMKMKIKMKNRSLIYDINLGTRKKIDLSLDMDTNIVNIRNF